MTNKKPEYVAPEFEALQYCLDTRMLSGSTEDYEQEPFDPFN